MPYALDAIRELAARFNAGHMIGPFDSPVEFWNCEMCGRYFATENEANDCEWLCGIDDRME